MKSRLKALIVRSTVSSRIVSVGVIFYDHFPSGKLYEERNIKIFDTAFEIDALPFGHLCLALPVECFLLMLFILKYGTKL